jgi:citrate synthase
MTAAEAADLLGVKLQTLYAYASRGLVQSIPSPRGRARHYLRGDLERLRTRRNARAGHGAVAASALQFGPPILESSITWFDEGGAVYRGWSAVELASSDTPFESVAELLWTGERPTKEPAWPPTELGLPASRLASLVPEGAHPLTALALVVPALAARDPGRFDERPEAVLPRARALIRRLAASLALGVDLDRMGRALRAKSIAQAVATALRARGGAEGVLAINRALVLMADHELNTSAFAARVVASTGADPYACISAALAALSGPRHGGASESVEALVLETEQPERAQSVLEARTRRGEIIPGFGHPIYREGDPRTAPLLEIAQSIAPRARDLRTLIALVDAMRDMGRPAANPDVGIVALCYALGLPAGSGAALFAVGRTAGWIAHVLEQYEAGFLLRPRATPPGL